MLPDPMERNVNPLLIQTGTRTVKKLVLTLAIHDKSVTMVKPTRAGITIGTGLAFPSEERAGTKGSPTQRAWPPHAETMSFSTPQLSKEPDPKNAPLNSD